MPISLDRPSTVKRGSGRPSLDSASGVIVSGFALIPPRAVNHSGFRSGRVLIDRFPDSFPRPIITSLHSLVNAEFYSHHGSTMTSSPGWRSPGRFESLGLGYEIMYTAPLRLIGRSPAVAHVFETPGRPNRVPWRLPRCCSTIWPSNGLQATSRTFHTRNTLFLQANQTSSLISQKKTQIEGQRQDGQWIPVSIRERRTSTSGLLIVLFAFHQMSDVVMWLWH